MPRVGAQQLKPKRLWYYRNMSRKPSKRIEQKLAQLTREFFARHPSVKLIAVTGSAGKTSVKIAIGTMVAHSMNIQLREEEPATKADVFLQIMGVRLPKKRLFRWSRAIRAVKKRVRAETPEVQAIVQEFSPKELGYNAWFRDYIVPDITVVTSVTDGRMEIEHSLEDVAREMISLANNSRMAIINRDDIEGRFAAFLTNPNITTYGTSSLAEYFFNQHSLSIETGNNGAIISPENPAGLPVNLHIYGENNLRNLIVAAAVGYKLGLPEAHIKQTLDTFMPLPGRMSVLRGADATWLLDDSYSSTPQTALLAMQFLYSLDVPQRIAVLGTMNGLRGTYEQAHAELGSLCSIELLDWVVTVGDKANAYLAPAARQNGCQVKECRDAIEAGSFVREKLRPDGVALFKGSSGGVWLEEAIKMNLAATSDEDRLVRQDPAWLERKSAFFADNRAKTDTISTRNT